MITLIIRLCALCAVSSLMELASTGMMLKETLRLICGMIMLTVTVYQFKAVTIELMQQQELMGIFECIMR